MASDPDRLVSKVFDACIGTLLAAMALWGAVEIISSIWVALCVGLLVISIVAGIAGILVARYRRW